MAIDQDWSAFPDQAFLAANDTLLARTAAGPGVEVSGSAIMAQRGAGAFYDATANARFLSPNSASTGTVILRDAVGDPGACYIQATNNANTVQYGYIRGVNGSWVATGNWQPAADNGGSLGGASVRWAQVYAVVGTINTSDQRAKVWRGAMNAGELRAARRIIAELGFYQWTEAVAEKGDAARLHFGARAQQVWRIMADEGLVDPIGADGKPGTTPYAFLCFDEWEATPGTDAVEEVRDGDGEIIQMAHPAVPPRPAGNGYGLRVDQLVLFLIAAQEARLAALEAA